MTIPIAATVSSVGEFLSWLEVNTPPALDRWYRGHASAGWDLTASVFRSPNRRQNERVLLKRFIQDARRHLEVTPTDTWDWVFLAQHHHVPTRLLDWSENALIGLYFAAQDHLDMPGDPLTARPGRIWILEPTVLNDRAGLVVSSDRDIPMFSFDPALGDYDPFTGVAHHRSPVAALAPRAFPRISVQWGTFTVTNTPDTLDTLAYGTDVLTCLEVPVAAKPDIRTQLGRLGLEDRTIYPDLFRLGASLAEVYG